MSPARILALKVLSRVLQARQSLSQAWPEALAKHASISDEDRRLAHQLVYGVCRHYHYLLRVLSEVLHKDHSDDQWLERILLQLGAYQLIFLRIPDHAVIFEMVEIAKQQLDEASAKRVNGILRALQRQQAELLSRFPSDEDRAHPKWLKKVIEKAWSDEAGDIFLANNHPAPMHLRVNLTAHSRDEYLQLLQAADMPATAHAIAPSAVTLETPCDVHQLPGFSEGWVSVQDLAAQCAATLLAPEPGHLVLDACAAPGGKTAHLLECCSDIQLWAIDQDAKRLEKVQATLKRIQKTATVVHADVLTWEPKQQFDRILLDAPCSATGVIRRHPDIKLLRKATDIPALAEGQLKLLTRMWSLLKPGGVLLYATCSILPQENDQVIAAFCAEHPDAKVRLPQLESGKETQYGCQIFPHRNGPDGFYYARLHK